MLRFIGRRLLYSVLVLLGVLLIVHGLLLITGDPTAALLPIDTSSEVRDQLRADLGLDDSFPVQYVKFVGRAFQGDFGDSYRQVRPAFELVLERAPATLQLGLVGLGIALLFGGTLGALSAVRKGTWIDRLARLVAVAGQSLPSFWLGLMLMLVFGVKLQWLPISGSGTWQHLVMPGIVVALPTLPAVVRIYRSSLIGVLERDYVRTARAKGLSGWQVFRHHVTRNASIPVVTVIAFEVGSILSGALIAEVIFAYPGMGRLAYQAILNRDLAVVQAFVFLVSIVVLITNMLLDVSYALLDPRVRVK
jgi:peptide/nickel transport system permease protein